MGFATRTALRLIFSKKKKTFINFLSYISIIALSIGTAAMIVVLSVYNGLENTLKSIYKDFDPEIKVEKFESKYFEDTYKEVISSIENVSEVSSIIENKVVLQNEEKEVVAYLKGVDNNFTKQNRISKNLTEGRFVFNFDNLDYGVIGRGIKYSLGIRTNSDFQSIKVFSLNEGKKLTPSMTQQKMYNEDFLKTAGVFAIESGFDNNYIFTSLGFAQTLFDKKNYVSSYEIMVEDKENIEQTKEKIKGALGSGFLVLTNVEQRAGLYKILQTEKLVVYFVFFIVLFLSAINIFFLLIMMGVEKRKNLQTLLVLGGSKNDVGKIFFYQGLMISVSGCFIGLLIACGLLILQQNLSLFMITSTLAYPVVFELNNFLFVFFVVFVYVHFMSHGFCLFSALQPVHGV